jgi:subfamily B ATP-binding cassette protein MsbA
VASLLSAGYLGLLQPMLDILFLQDIERTVPAPGEPAFTTEYLKVWFEYHFTRIARENGPVNTLMFVCLSIVGLVLLSNVFRYMERMVASRVKVDVVKNMRVDIFRSISQLHIGFFTDQRKGDLLSRFTNDVAEVENTVVSGFKAIRVFQFL